MEVIMKKVLILNGHQYYKGPANGELTEHFIERAKEFFLKNDFSCADGPSWKPGEP